MNWPEHGGQPAAMKKLFRMEKEMDVLDFSANLNPLGPPAWLKDSLVEQLTALPSYPDPHYAKSSSYLARYEGIEEEELLLTNGGAEAVFLAAKYFEGKKAAIIHPAFSEYERACRHYHLDVTEILLSPDNDFRLPMNSLIGMLPDIDVLFLCRPNNPTGTAVPKAEIKMLLEEGLKNDTYLIVDEAFVDFVPSQSLTPMLKKHPNLLLLRSLTKMYTIPGLRLGYMMGNRDVIKVVKEEQIPWSVNGLADAAVPGLLEDKEYVAGTLEWLGEQSGVLRSFFMQHDFYMSPTCANFYLLQDKRNPERTESLFAFLFEHGILARHTHNFKGLDGEFLRLAVRSE
jgi:threonine-phosphate decarboxylase